MSTNLCVNPGQLCMTNTRDNSKNSEMWQVSFQADRLYPDERLSIYLPNLNSESTVATVVKLDPLLYFSGCQHLTLKIFQYLDSCALLAASLVCQHWQQFVCQHFWANNKVAKKVQSNIFSTATCNKMQTLRLDLKTTGKVGSRIIDVNFDDSFNLLVLTCVSGTPQVLFASIFSKARLRWIHRFRDYLEPLTCISSGMNLVALGSKYGKIYVYEMTNEHSKSISISAILAHHSSQVHEIVFHSDQIISCSDDMTIGIVNILNDQSLVLTRILQGHVSRVKLIKCQQDLILSGSDDRTVKVWNSKSSNSLRTLSGHCGPITALLLAHPLAFSASGSTVRLWDIDKGTCLKLLQNNIEGDGCITCLNWIPAFNGVFTLDTRWTLRSFLLQDKGEILQATSWQNIPNGTGGKSTAACTVNVKMEGIPQLLFLLTFSTDMTCNPFVAIKFIDFIS